MNNLLLDLGGKIVFDGTRISEFGPDKTVEIIDNSNINKLVAEYDYVKKMRASFFTLGPLLARFKQAKVSLPGGCAIGARGVDIHLDGLKAFGVKIDIVDGYVFASADNGLDGCEYTLPFASVGATENLISVGILAKGTTILKNVAKEPNVIALIDFYNSIGAKISGKGTDILTIQGVKQEDLHSTTFIIPADNIEAGTYAIASAITDGEVLLTGCTMLDFIGVKEIFEKIGIGLKEVDETNKKGVLAYKLHDFIHCDIETAVFPGFPTDLQAQMMIPLLLANGESKVIEKIFENRFMHVPELCRMGANINVHGNTAMLKGNTHFKSANVMATDLRASAALVLAGLIAEGETVIDRIYHLDRGYEKLEMKLNNCGAKIIRSKSSL